MKKCSVNYRIAVRVNTHMLNPVNQSEEKAEEEAKARIHVENRLKEALQECTNLKTELQVLAPELQVLT